MTLHLRRLLAAGILVALMGGVSAIGQSSPGSTDTVQAHTAAAKAAAGQGHTFLFNQLCAEPAPARSAQPNPAPAAAPGPPDRSTWHAEPAKVFDNLYFVGQTEYSSWAVTTSAGIIVIDTIFDYSVEDEVAGGLKKMAYS